MDTEDTSTIGTIGSLISENFLKPSMDNTRGMKHGQLDDDGIVAPRDSCRAFYVTCMMLDDDGFVAPPDSCRAFYSNTCDIG